MTKLSMMTNLHIHKKRENNTVTYEYSFETTPPDGKREKISQSGFKDKDTAMLMGKKAQVDYAIALQKNNERSY